MERSHGCEDDRDMNRGPSFLISLLMLAAVLFAGPGLAAAPPDDPPCATATGGEIDADCDSIDGAEREFVTND